MSVTISQLHKRSSEFNGSIEPWIGPVLIPKDPRVNFDEPGLKYEVDVVMIGYLICNQMRRLIIFKKLNF